MKNPWQTPCFQRALAEMLIDAPRLAEALIFSMQNTNEYNLSALAEEELGICASTFRGRLMRARKKIKGKIIQLEYKASQVRV